MPQGLDTSPSTSTPWASDLPSTIAKVPRVATLIEDLGIGGTSKSVDRFKTVLKSFRQDYVTKSGARVSDLNDWHSDAHQEDLALAAMAFMEQQGQLFWPDEGFTENTKWLGVTADHDDLDALKGMETLSLSQFRDYIREKTEHEICDSGPRGICVIVRDPFGVNETVKVLRDEGQQPLKRLLSQIRDLQDEALERYHEEHRTDVPLFKFTLEAWTS
ncbi:hypothetical protein O9K51_06814 [Purpureocillium lavendulum]|uniref:Reverse transcriptase domain-containing protein n=1 Tax=Purpureocillium lavendulum TaxID=1247861 RepID=A0AB34FQ13_9HYPO|nr:hypothetical protein O9K51_06814 [Purpureocillium lavendulum]